MSALFKLLAFAPLFNAQKKHFLNYFALKMDAFVVAKRDTAENRERVVERRVFFPHILIYFEWMLFWMSEEHIMRTYRLPSHAIFNLLQEIKDDLEPSTRSHATPALSKLLANLHFLLASGSFQSTVTSLFFICDYANFHCAWYIALVDM